jgi:hypothetical protein
MLSVKERIMILGLDPKRLKSWKGLQKMQGIPINEKNGMKMQSSPNPKNHDLTRPGNQQRIMTRLKYFLFSSVG